MSRQDANIASPAAATAPPAPAHPAPRAWFWLGLSAGAGAALVALAAILLLIVGHMANKAGDPLELDAKAHRAKPLAERKARLSANPRDLALAKTVRQLDSDLRKQFWGQVMFARRGNWLLLAAIAVFAIGTRSAIACVKRLRRPIQQRPDAENEMRLVKLGWWAVASLTLLLGIAAATPSVHAILTAQPPPPPPRFPTAEQYAANSFQFRGPGAQGRSAYANVPVEWDGNSGQGVLWKTPIPLPGNNSAVVWGDRVFATGAGEARREVYCFDAGSGKMLWASPAENIQGSPAKVKVFKDTGFAASTAACDDRFVFAVFANGDLACFDREGKMVWGKNLGAPKNQYSHAASLAMWRNLVIVQYDQGQAEEMLSKIHAFDAATGRAVWQKRRAANASWSTPAVINDGKREQALTSATPWVIAYDPATGGELWKANCLTGDVASTVAFADGVAYAVNTGAKLSAIRTDGSGDVTASHVLWQGEDGLSDTTSPVTDGKLLWTEAKRTLTCLDARNGKPVYEQKLKGNFQASPALAGGRLYITSTKGETFVIDAGREYKLLGANPLGEACSASPAFQDGRIYLRGAKNLFCIGHARPRSVVAGGTGDNP
jgi:outer membrane protein assembly factor BamB